MINVVQYIDGKFGTTILGNKRLVEVDVGLTAEFKLEGSTWYDQKTNTVYEFYNWVFSKMLEEKGL